MTSGRGVTPRCIEYLHYLCPHLRRPKRHTKQLGIPFGFKLLAKEELLTIEGIIEEILPDGRFAVRLDNEHKIIAYTAGKMRKFRIRSVVGDRVHLEMTPYDLTKGRIVFRERDASQSGSAKRRTNFRK